MIYTVTFNPSLDYIVRVDDFRLGRVNRTSSEQILPGGKGINVSIVLQNLGVDNMALGFMAGFTGGEIAKKVSELGCGTDFTWLSEGYSRINLKLSSKEESEINSQGPSITEKALYDLYEKLNRLGQEDILVLAGSIPATLPDSIYEQIMQRLYTKDLKIVVDATGDLLVNVLKFHPFLIKPNNHELSEIFGVELKNEEDIIKYASQLQGMGARNVLISRAGDGAVLIAESGEVFTSPAPKGKVINSVGAGDSMVAGFLTGYLESQDYKQSFKMGIAAGSASAFSTQLATRAEVLGILKKLTF